jgi:hypothetical protein
MAKRRSTGMQSYLFNFAAIGVGVTTVLLATFGMRSKDTITPCSERYGVATQFSLQRSAGEPAAAVELQARLGGRDWGVAENAQVVKTPDGPGALALQVNIPSPSTSGPLGLGFTWLLPDANPARAACLSYHVFVPQNFEYGEGGILPGLFGGKTAAAPKDGNNLISSSFGTHLLWSRTGALTIRIATASDTGGIEARHLGPSQLTLPTGRWVAIEQEIVLNANGLADGMVRAWIDGRIALDKANVAWRTQETSSFRGADVRAHFTHGSLEPWRAPKATQILLSPLETRWQ